MEAPHSSACALAVAVAIALGSSACESGAPASALPACHESYPEDCLDPEQYDYDCAVGDGDGPNWVKGPIKVDHSVSDPDPFNLDPDGDGTACDHP